MQPRYTSQRVTIESHWWNWGQGKGFIVNAVRLFPMHNLYRDDCTQLLAAKVTRDFGEGGGEGREGETSGDFDTAHHQWDPLGT